VRFIKVHASLAGSVALGKDVEGIRKLGILVKGTECVLTIFGETRVTLDLEVGQVAVLSQIFIELVIYKSMVEGHSHEGRFPIVFIVGEAIPNKAALKVRHPDRGVVFLALRNIFI
jgi:hypothetical protein